MLYFHNDISRACFIYQTMSNELNDRYLKFISAICYTCTRRPAIRLCFSIRHSRGDQFRSKTRARRTWFENGSSRRWRRRDSTCCRPAKVSKSARSAAMSHIRVEAAEYDSGTVDRRVRLLRIFRVRFMSRVFLVPKSCIMGGDAVNFGYWIFEGALDLAFLPRDYKKLGRLFSMTLKSGPLFIRIVDETITEINFHCFLKLFLLFV